MSERKWCARCRRRPIPPHGARYCDQCWQVLYGPRPEHVVLDPPEE